MLRTGWINEILKGFALMVTVVGLTALPLMAGNVQDARVQKGTVAYETYCTPCHGANGAPGTAVFAATKKPIDLRTYQQRNGGTFPSERWWDVTFNPEQRSVHSAVWERIRAAQHEADDRDITARGVVANIEEYVMSIQKRNR